MSQFGSDTSPLPISPSIIQQVFKAHAKFLLLSLVFFMPLLKLSVLLPELSLL
ncbi:MAG: hypothetical protein AAFX01_13775 [Cyanobacteria bacterium J06638_28]